jgi:hypothetical protein
MEAMETPCRAKQPDTWLNTPGASMADMRMKYSLSQSSLKHISLEGLASLMNVGWEWMPWVAA